MTDAATDAPPTDLPTTPVRRVTALGVHVLTASGIVFMFLAAAELCQAQPRAWLVFVWFVGATLVDAIDGPLARRFHVKAHAAEFDGRTIDDIVDFLGFTFLPIMLIWRMGWVPGGPALWAGIWVVPALLCSLLGFSHRHAKDEEAGFFRGFPSYWNIAAFYAGLTAAALPAAGPWINVVVLLVLAVLTVSPVWFVYPNLAPRKWKPIILWGSYAWALLLVAMLPVYPTGVPGWLTLVSLLYPAAYAAVSLHLRPSWPSPRRDLHASVEGR